MINVLVKVRRITEAFGRLDTPIWDSGDMPVLDRPDPHRFMATSAKIPSTQLALTKQSAPYTPVVEDQVKIVHCLIHSHITFTE